MNRRTAYWLVGGAVVGIAIVAVTAATAKPAEQRVTGLPSTRRLTYSTASVNQDYWTLGAVVPLLDGAPVLRNDLERSRAFSNEFHVSAGLRRAQLPKGANQQNIDKWSKELYWAPSWLTHFKPNELNPQVMSTALNGTPIDEFGRTKEGHFGNQDQSLWGQTLGGLLKNKLFAFVATVAVLAAPGGIAIYGAYTMWQMRGRELTLKNVAMTAARAYVASQCGEGCAVAFDMGVGVASGQSADKAAENALVKQMTPEQKLAYEQGKKNASAVRA